MGGGTATGGDTTDMIKALIGRVIDENQGAIRITQERIRQTTAEPYSFTHDDAHVNCELTQAATCYAVFALWQTLDPEDTYTVPGEVPGEFERDPAWPWAESDWKPSTDPVRNLEKAGALIAAEIDRLLRARSKDA